MCCCIRCEYASRLIPGKILPVIFHSLLPSCTTTDLCVSANTWGFGSTRHSCNDWQDFLQLVTKCMIARKWVAKPLNDDVFKCIHLLHATNMVADHFFTILATRVYGTLIFSPSLSRFSIPATSLFCKFCSKGWWVVVNWVQNFSLFECG